MAEPRLLFLGESPQSSEVENIINFVSTKLPESDETVLQY